MPPCTCRPETLFISHSQNETVPEPAKETEKDDAREEVGATADVVVHKAVVVLLVAKLFERVGPQDVAHQSVRRRFAETVDLRFDGGGPGGRVSESG
jgi:hypothetical protein